MISTRKWQLRLTLEHKRPKQRDKKVTAQLIAKFTEKQYRERL
jgi:hypothetical protein